MPGPLRGIENELAGLDRKGRIKSQGLGMHPDEHGLLGGLEDIRVVGIAHGRVIGRVVGGKDLCDRDARAGVRHSRLLCELAHFRCRAGPLCGLGRTRGRRLGLCLVSSVL